MGDKSGQETQSYSFRYFQKIIKMFSGSYGQERKAMRTYFKILYMIMAISWSTCFWEAIRMAKKQSYLSNPMDTALTNFFMF